MAARRTNSFFIRAELDMDNDSTFSETEVSLGAFVDALGQSVLHIKQIQVQYTNADQITGVITTTVADSTSVAKWQLMTQSQTTLVTAADRAMIASGSFTASRLTGGFVLNNEVSDPNPSEWEDGFIVAVDSIFLGGHNFTTMNSGVNVALVMECEVVKLTKEAALALALSQQ
jgi:hypothetical protein